MVSSGSDSTLLIDLNARSKGSKGRAWPGNVKVEEPLSVMGESDDNIQLLHK